LECGSRINVTGPTFVGNALAKLVEGQLIYRRSFARSARRRLKHWRDGLANLDRRQLTQAAWDKFDCDHRLRHALAPPIQSSSVPVVLLPSAYVNVSRTAVAYARMLPEQQFLLVCARKNGWLRDGPSNVRITTLDSFFQPLDRAELSQLLMRWR